MEAFICVACGAQYPPSVEPPQVCPGCVDERQAFPVGGQQWTTLSRVHHTRFTVFREHEPNVIGIGTEPKLGIGQRAVLVQTEHGNILWDLTPYIDETTVQIINGLGGIQTIAISHPHFYTTMHDWSEAFDNAPIYLHEADRDFVRRSSPNIRFWDGESHELVPGATLIQAGGHFAGGTMMHWAPGAGRRRQGSSLQLRHDVHHARQPVRDVHARIPHPHPALCRRGARGRSVGRWVRVRPNLRPLLRHGDPRGCAARCGRFAGPVHRCCGGQVRRRVG